MQEKHHKENLNDLILFFNSEAQSTIESFLSELFCPFYLQNFPTRSLHPDFFIDFFISILEKVPPNFQILKEKKIAQKFQFLKTSSNSSNEQILSKIKELGSVYIFDPKNQEISNPIIYEIGVIGDPQQFELDDEKALQFVTIFDFLVSDKTQPFAFKCEKDKEVIFERQKNHKKIIKKKFYPICHIQEKGSFLFREFFTFRQIPVPSQKLQRRIVFDTFLFRDQSHKIETMIDTSKIMQVAKSERSTIWKTFLSIFRNIFDSKEVYQQFKEHVLFLSLSSTFEYLNNSQRKQISYNLISIIKTSSEYYSKYLSKIYNQFPQERNNESIALLESIQKSLSEIKPHKLVPNDNVNLTDSEFPTAFQNFSQPINNQNNLIKNNEKFFGKPPINFHTPSNQVNVPNREEFKEEDLKLVDLLDKLNQIKEYATSITQIGGNNSNNSNQNQKISKNDNSVGVIASILMAMKTPSSNSSEMPEYYQIHKAPANEDSRKQLIELMEILQFFEQSISESISRNSFVGLAVFNSYSIIHRIINIYEYLFVEKEREEKKMGHYKIYAEAFYQFYYNSNLPFNAQESTKLHELKKFFDAFGAKEYGFGYRMYAERRIIPEEIRYLSSVVNQITDDQITQNYIVGRGEIEINPNNFISRNKFYDHHFKNNFGGWINQQIKEIEQKWIKESNHLALALFYNFQVKPGQEKGFIENTCTHFLEYSKEKYGSNIQFKIAKDHFENRGELQHDGKTPFTIKKSYETFQELLKKEIQEMNENLEFIKMKIFFYQKPSLNGNETIWGWYEKYISQCKDQREQLLFRAIYTDLMMQTRKEVYLQKAIPHFQYLLQKENSQIDFIPNSQSILNYNYRICLSDLELHDQIFSLIPENDSNPRYLFLRLYSLFLQGNYSNAIQLAINLSQLPNQPFSQIHLKELKNKLKMKQATTELNHQNYSQAHKLYSEILEEYPNCDDLKIYIFKLEKIQNLQNANLDKDLKKSFQDLAVMELYCEQNGPYQFSLDNANRQFPNLLIFNTIKSQRDEIKIYRIFRECSFQTSRYVYRIKTGSKTDEKTGNIITNIQYLSYPNISPFIPQPKPLQSSFVIDTKYQNPPITRIISGGLISVSNYQPTVILNPLFSPFVSFTETEMVEYPKNKDTKLISDSFRETNQKRKEYDENKIRRYLHENEFVSRIQPKQTPDLQEELCLIRLKCLNQPSLLIEYITKDFTLLEKKPFRDFILLTLFEKHYLSKVLSKESDHILQFKLFLQEFKRHIQIIDREEQYLLMWFYFVLKIHFNEYCRKMNLSEAFLMKSIEQELDQEIWKIEKEIQGCQSQTEENILEKAKNYLFSQYTILYQHRNYEENGFYTLTQDQIRKCLLSKMRITLYGFDEENQRETSPTEKEHDFFYFSILNILFERISKVDLVDTLQKFKYLSSINLNSEQDLNSITFEKQFPYLIVKHEDRHYHINILTGELFVNGSSLIHKLDSYKKDPIYEQIFGENPLFNIKRTMIDSKFLIEYNDTKDNPSDLQIIVNETQIILLRHKVPIKNHPNDSSSQHKHLTFFPNQERKEIPLIFRHKQYFHWIDHETTRIYIQKIPKEFKFENEYLKISEWISKTEPEFLIQKCNGKETEQNYELIDLKNGCRLTNLIENPQTLLNSNQRKSLQSFSSTINENEIKQFHSSQQEKSWKFDNPDRENYGFELCDSILIWNRKQDNQNENENNNENQNQNQNQKEFPQVIEFPRYYHQKSLILFQFNQITKEYDFVQDPRFHLLLKPSQTEYEILCKNPLIQRKFNMLLFIKNEKTQEIKIIIPARMLSGKWDDLRDKPFTEYECLIMKIDEKGDIFPQNEEECFLISFLYLEHQCYEESMESLSVIEPISSFSPLSFRIGIWIITQLTWTYRTLWDHHPLAASIRIVCAQMIFENYLKKNHSIEFKKDYHNTFYYLFLHDISNRYEFYHLYLFRGSLLANLNVYQNFCNWNFTPKMDCINQIHLPSFYYDLHHKFDFQNQVFKAVSLLRDENISNEKSIPFPQTLEFVHFEISNSYPTTTQSKILFYNKKTHLAQQSQRNFGDSNAFQTLKTNPARHDFEFNISNDFSKFRNLFLTNFRSILLLLCDQRTTIRQDVQRFVDLKVWMKFLNLENDILCKLKNIILLLWEKRNVTLGRIENPFEDWDQPNGWNANQNTFEERVNQILGGFGSKDYFLKFENERNAMNQFTAETNPLHIPSTEQIIKEITTQYPKYAQVNITNVEKNEYFNSQKLITQIEENLETEFANYFDEEKKEDSPMEKFKMEITQEKFEVPKPNKPFIEKKQKEFLEDQNSGREKNQNEKYHLQIKKDKTLELFCKFLESKKEDLISISNKIEEEINEMLKKTGQNEDQNLRKLKIFSKEIVEVKREEMMNLFSHFESEPFKTYNKNLDEKDIEILFGKFLLFLQAGICIQKINRTIKLLEKFPKDHPIQKVDEEINEKFKMIKNTITAKRDLKPLHEYLPQILVFEYRNNIMLRPRQVEILGDIFKFYEEKKKNNFQETPNNPKKLIIQLLMGQGKTKVIGPILAFIQNRVFWDQNPLVIFLSPVALLETNAQDMKKTSKQTFNQRIHVLHFSRDEENTSKQSLEEILFSLKNAQIKSEFVISSAESIQCLELEYTALLNEMQDDIQMANKNKEESNLSPQHKKEIDDKLEIELAKNYEKVKILNEILSMMKEHSLVTIDEVDTVLSVFRNVNFTTGKKDLKFQQYQIEVAKIIYEEFQEELKNNTNTTLDEKSLETTKEKTNKTRKELIISRIIKKILESAVDNEFYRKINEYLKNKEKIEIGDFPIIQENDENDQELEKQKKDEKDEKEKILRFPRKFALCRYLLNDLLFKVITKQPNEHFGISKIEWMFGNTISSKTHVSIPYRAANTPVEGSIFANVFETLFKTIHYYFYVGLPESRTRHFLYFLQRKYKEYVKSRDQEKNVIHDNVQNTFGIEISTMRIDSVKQEKLEIIRKYINENLFNEMDIFVQYFHKYINEEILSQFACESKQLNSTSSDLCSFFKCIVGYSGTSQTEKRDKDLGRVVDSLLQVKREKIFSVDYKKTPSELFEYIYEKNSNNFDFHAFIDVGAYFKDFTNSEVSMDILSFFCKKKPSIKGVLFFNDEDKLMICKLKQEKDAKICDTSEMIVQEIGGSDPNSIQNVSQLDQEELFSYYDQSHTIGTDITQPLFSNALLTISETTQSVQLLQGAMRMRKLNLGTQKISFVIPKTTLNFIEKNFIEDFRKDEAENNKILSEISEIEKEIEKEKIGINKLEPLQETLPGIQQEVQKSKAKVDENEKKIETLRKTLKKSDFGSSNVIKFTFLNDVKQLSLNAFHEFIQETNTIIKSSIYDLLLDIKDRAKKLKIFKIFSGKGEIFIKKILGDLWDQFKNLTKERSIKDILQEFIQNQDYLIKELFSNFRKEVEEDTQKINELEQKLRSKLKEYHQNFTNSFSALPDTYFSSDSKENTNQTTHVKLELLVHEEEEDKAFTGPKMEAKQETLFDFSLFSKRNFISEMENDTNFTNIQKINDMMHPKVKSKEINGQNISNRFMNYYVTNNFISPLGQSQEKNFYLRFFVKLLFLKEKETNSSIWIFVTQQEAEDIMKYISKMQKKGKENEILNPFVLMNLDGFIFTRFGQEFQGWNSEIISKGLLDQYSFKNDIIDIRDDIFNLGLIKKHPTVFNIGGKKNILKKRITQSILNGEELINDFLERFSQNVESFRKKIASEKDSQSKDEKK